jgi:prepilin-type N-terminal cleavage/methylation domain-containing protein
MNQRNEKGFTLIEMVASMTLLAVLAAAAVPFMSNGVQAYNNTASGLQAVSKLRYASERLVRELREIRHNGANYDITTPVTTAGNDIRFRKSDLEWVNINTNAPNLTMNYETLASGADFILSDGLTSINFDYYRNDGANSPLGTADVAYIEFELVLNSNGASYSQRTRVALRNRP